MKRSIAPDYKPPSTRLQIVAQILAIDTNSDVAIAYDPTETEPRFCRCMVAHRVDRHMAIIATVTPDPTADIHALVEEAVKLSH